MFSSELSYYKYGELKDNVYNIYLAVFDIVPQTYNAVLHITDGFKPTPDCQHNSGGAQKDKLGVDFVSPAEVKEKRSAGVSKLPQSKAVSGVQKKEYVTMPSNEAGHSNCSHYGSKHHWA